jgi:hypothetical protein
MPSTPLLRILRSLIVLAGLSIAAGGAWNLEARAAPQAVVSPFLYPPFPGSASEESIFDHTSPNYTQSDNRIVSHGGQEARKNCPSPPPSGSPPPQQGVCDRGFGVYWSYSLGDWIAYNGHDGIDYGISYRPVYAAAIATGSCIRLVDPQNHRSPALRQVIIPTAMSRLTATARGVRLSDRWMPRPHCEMIGISGTTGNPPARICTLRPLPAGRSIDPYGWGTAAPTALQQPESLWVMYPSLVSSGPRILPTGNVALPYPPAAPVGILIDDSSSGFAQSPAQCWNDISVSAGQAQNGNMSYAGARLTAPSCTGQWQFPIGSSPGLYSVYVRIPAYTAPPSGAVYAIQHGGRADRCH